MVAFLVSALFLLGSGHASENELSGELLRDMHRKVDTNSDGKLSRAEIQEHAQRLTSEFARRGASKLLVSTANETGLDRNGDGVLSLNEYLTKVSGTLLDEQLNADALTTLKKHKLHGNSTWWQSMFSSTSTVPQAEPKEGFMAAKVRREMRQQFRQRIKAVLLKRAQRHATKKIVVQQRKKDGTGSVIKATTTQAINAKASKPNGPRAKLPQVPAAKNVVPKTVAKAIDAKASKPKGPRAKLPQVPAAKKDVPKTVAKASANNIEPNRTKPEAVHLSFGKKAAISTKLGKAVIKAERRKFRAADADHDGVLNSTEAQSLLFPETKEEVFAIHVGDALRAADLDGDGRLSKKEFFVDAETTDGSAHIADFRALDLDKDGYLSAAEYGPWESGVFHMEDAIREALRLADADGDAELTADELAKSAKLLSQSHALPYFAAWVSGHGEL